MDLTGPAAIALTDGLDALYASVAGGTGNQVLDIIIQLPGQLTYIALNMIADAGAPWGSTMG